MEDKPLIAIDTSTAVCSICVYFSKEKFYKIDIKDYFSHSKVILSSIKNLLKESKSHIRDIRGVAINIGPGSFTGLRIGLAVAKALAFSSNTPLLPVSSFDIILSKAISTLKLSHSLQSNISIALNAGRDEAYFCYFKCNSSSVQKINSLDYHDSPPPNPSIESRNYKMIHNFSFTVANKKDIFDLSKDSVLISSVYDSDNVTTQNSSLDGISDNSAQVDSKISFVKDYLSEPDSFFLGFLSDTYFDKLQIDNYDILEPLYLKDFIPKRSTK